MNAAELPGITEPACGSWPVPALLPDEEVAENLAQRGIPPHLSRAVLPPLHSPGQPKDVVLVRGASPYIRV